MQNISLVDETFDLNFISEYHLSIQLNLDGLSFCIMDGIQKKYVCLFHHPILANTTGHLVKSFKELFKENEYLKADYKSVRIVHSSSNATLVPPSYVDQAPLDKFMELNFGEAKNEKIFKTPLSPFHDILLDSMPLSLVNFIEEKYQDVSIYHECKPFLWNVIRQGNQTDQLALLIRGKYCWIIYLMDNKLKFVNSFKVENDDDVLYYALNVVKELELNPEKTHLLIDGLTSKKSAIYHRFRQYLKHVRLAELSTDYQYSYLFNQLPDNRFNCLLNLYACEL